MRKFVAPALVGFGTFLLVVGVLALSWVPGAVKKTPLDVDTTTMLSGEAAKIDPATGDMTPRAIHAISLTRTDSKASTDDDVVWPSGRAWPSATAATASSRPTPTPCCCRRTSW